MSQESLLPQVPMPRRFSTDERGTPEWFFAEAKYRYAFGGEFHLDVCASEWNHKCPEYITEDEDAFLTDWRAETCWCNPPYSSIHPWLLRGIDQVSRGQTKQVVFLLPNRSSTKWWQELSPFMSRRVELPFRIPFDYPPGELQKRDPYEHSTLWILEAPMRREDLV